MRNEPRKRSGVMLCYDYSERRLLRWPKPWIVQPKLEGDRCRAVVEETNEGYVWTLYSSTAAVRTSVPHINDALQMACIHSYEELDGELYAHGARHEDIRSVVSRTQNLHPNYSDIEYHIFDVISTDTQSYRMARLNALKVEPPLVIVPHYTAHSLEGPQSINYFYDKFLEEGYEGIIIRHPQALYERRRMTTIMKLKPREELKAVVIELVEERDKNGTAKNALGAIRCVHPAIRNTFEVGTGFTRAERLSFWKEPSRILGKIAEIQYQALTAESIKMTSFKRIVDDYSNE